MKKAVGIVEQFLKQFTTSDGFKILDMTTKVIKEQIHTNENEAIQQSKENGEARYLGFFRDDKGEWLNKKLYKKGKLILNEIYNLTNSIVL